VKRRTYNEPGHAHELTFSCFRGFQFLKAKRVCRWLAGSIEKARSAHEFDLWAYVFMPEHVHLILWPRRKEYRIETIRQAIKQPVARKATIWLEENRPDWIPRITVEKGKVSRRRFWQKGAGYDRNIFEYSTLLHMIDYIHDNPVRRDLCSKPTDWRWSSATAHIGNQTGPLAIDPVPKDWLE